MSSSPSSSSSHRRKRSKKKKHAKHSKHNQHGNSRNKSDKRSTLKKQGKEEKRKRVTSAGHSSSRTASTGSDADLPPPRPTVKARVSSGLLGPQAPSGLLDAASDASDLSPSRHGTQSDARPSFPNAGGDFSPPRRPETIPSFVDARRRADMDKDLSPPRKMAERSRSHDQLRMKGTNGKGSTKGNFDGAGGGTKGKGKGKDGKGKVKDLEEPVEKEQPTFEASGLLAVEDNSKNGVALKFVLPPEARTPTIKWRLYCFTKGTDAPKILHICKMPGYLFGKDRRIADIPTDHQTCSKQHAVLHFRAGPDGRVKPYIMDLESINGTFLNGTRIEAARYNELREKDVLKFGLSSREFVLLHGGSTKHQHIDPKMLRSPSPG